MFKAKNFFSRERTPRRKINCFYPFLLSCLSFSLRPITSENRFAHYNLPSHRKYRQTANNSSFVSVHIVSICFRYQMLFPINFYNSFCFNQTIFILSRQVCYPALVFYHSLLQEYSVNGMYICVCMYVCAVCMYLYVYQASGISIPIQPSAYFYPSYEINFKIKTLVVAYKISNNSMNLSWSLEKD